MVFLKNGGGKMEVRRLVKNKEDGTVEVDLMLSEDQAQFLVNFALGMLVREGIASFVDVEETGGETAVAESFDPSKLN
jgi:acylphosphatase